MALNYSKRRPVAKCFFFFDKITKLNTNLGPLRPKLQMSSYQEADSGALHRFVFGLNECRSRGRAGGGSTDFFSFRSTLKTTAKIISFFFFFNQCSSQRDDE